MNICHCAALTSPSRYNDFSEAEKDVSAGAGGIYSPPAGANFQTVVFYPPPDFHGGPASLLSTSLPGSPARSAASGATPPPPVPIVATRSSLLLI